MLSLPEYLSLYASYHRDRRNLVTHFVGIPMIVLATFLLLWHPTLTLWGSLTLNPALGAAVLSAAFYWRLNRFFGLVMTLVLAGFYAGAGYLTRQWTMQDTWIWGAGLFVLGWAIQFVGHAFEGRKPAFLDDLVGLLIGPLYLVAEVLFAVGFCPELAQSIKQKSAITPKT